MHSNCRRKSYRVRDHHEFSIVDKVVKYVQGRGILIIMRFWKFLQYNNAVPVVLSVLILGGGSAFAATDPAAVYSAQQQVVSIDNTYIANKDLSAYSPQAQITAVTEDTDNYYVAYDFTTIDLVNSTWQDTTKQRSLKVSKVALGNNDLGLYVAEQLKENVAAELVRLKDTQQIEKKSVTQKVVATVYGGLIGKMLDSSTETLPGYTPVIAPTPPSLASDASTTAQVASVAVVVPTPSVDTSQTTMTQDQITQLVQQQVNALLAQYNTGSRSGDTTVPPPASTPVPTPTPTPTPPADTGAASSTPVDNTPVPVSTPTPDPAPVPVVSDTATTTTQ